MTAQNPGSRRQIASAAVKQLIDVTLSHGPGAEAWYLKLLDIRDVLGSAAPDEDVLRDAAEMFDSLYVGPRNFSDFYIWSEDESERITENRRVEDTVRTLRDCLRP
jgi:hypothetical protein